MSVHKIGGKIVLEGEKEYKQAMREIKAAHSELRSEMKLASSSFDGQQNSLEALRKKHEILSNQYDVQSRKVDVLQKATADAAEKEEKYADKITALSKALSDAEKEMSEMKDSSDSTEEAIKAQEETISDLKRKLDQAREGYENATVRTSGYRTSLNLANEALESMDRELQRTGSYLREAEQSTDGCADSIDEYGREVSEASEKTSVFGDVLKANLTSDLIMQGIRAVADGIKAAADGAIDAGSAFEAGMSQVQAVSGASGEELDRLKEKAKEMGAKTKFSATESAEALNYMAMAGWKTEDMLGGLEGIMNLAAASGEDLASTSDIVTDALTAFGYTAKDSGHFADILAAASSNANTNVGMMGETFKYIAPIAGAMGYSAEDAAVAIGLMANASIKGSQAGTSLRSILTRLTKPTKDSETAMNALGLSVTDSAGRMKPLSEVIVDIRDAFAGLSANEKASYAAMLAGQEAMSGLLAIVNASATDFDKLSNAISDCNGSAEKMAGIMQDNLKGKITLLQSALEGLGISAYEIFDDEMKASVDSATNAVGRLQKSMDSGDLGVSMRRFSESLGESLEGAIDFGEDALPVIIDGLTWIIDNSEIVVSGITGITAATKGAAAAQAIFNLTMDANPIGAFAKALIGLTAALGAFVLLADDEAAILDENTKRTKELVEQSKELNEAYAQSAAERSASREGMKEEAAVCSKLVSELSMLQSKTELTMQEQSRQQAVVSQLNQAIPDLNLAIEEQTGKLNMSTRELEKNVDALMRQAKAEAARKDLTRIAEEQYEAEKQLARLEEQREEQIRQVERAQAEYNERMERSAEDALAYTATMEAMGGAETEWAAAVGQAKKAQEEIDDEIKSTQETIEGFTDEYNEAMSYISETEALDAAAVAIQGVGQAAEAAGVQTIEMSEEVQKAYSDMYDNVAGAIESQMDLFSQYEESSAVSAEQVLANMQSQIDGVTNWAENMAALADKGVNQGLLQTLSEMGPKGAGYVAAFVEMSEEQLEKANELYVDAVTLKVDTANEITQDWMTAGQNAVEGFSDGILSGSDATVTAGADLAKGVLDKMKDTLEINSPSKKTHDIGENTDIGLGDGIEAKKDYVLDIVEGVISEVILTTRDGFKPPVFTDIGKGIMSDLADGINAGKGGVINAISSAISGIVESALAELSTKADELSQYAQDSLDEMERGAKGKDWNGKNGSMGSRNNGMSMDPFSGYASQQDIKSKARELLGAQDAGYQQGTSPIPITLTVELKGDAEEMFNAMARIDDIYFDSTGNGRFEHKREYE